MYMYISCETQESNKILWKKKNDQIVIVNPIFFQISHEVYGSAHMHHHYFMLRHHALTWEEPANNMYSTLYSVCV